MGKEISFNELSITAFVKRVSLTLVRCCTKRI